MKDPSNSGARQVPHVSDDTLLDLLHHLLSESEAGQVLTHLAACPGCEDRFRERVAEQERLRATRVLRVAPGGGLVIERPTPEIPGQVEAGGGMWNALGRRWAGFVEGFRRPQYRWAGGLVVAVAVLLLVLVPRFGGLSGGDGLVWLPNSFDDARYRSSSPGVLDGDLASGLEAYANRDIDRAIRFLGRAEASGALETVRKVYLGSALAWKGEYERAADVLEGVASRALPDPWGREAWWTLYVALKKSGRTAEADSLLSVLAAEPGDIGDRALSEGRDADTE